MLDFKPIVSVNGRIGTSIDMLDRGLAYGDGLFETMLLHKNGLPYWKEHVHRLASGCERLKLSIDNNTVLNYVTHIIDQAKTQGIDDALFKIIVTRGVAGRGYQPSLSVPPTVIVMVLPLPLIPESFYQQGVDVFICQHRLTRNPLLAGMKHLNKLDYVMAAQEWQSDEYQEALLFDTENNLIEATSRNIFIIKDKKIYTPKLDQAGVEGVARNNIIRVCQRYLSQDVVETEIDLAFLLSADEVFLSNSVTGIWPVKSIMGTALGNQTDEQSDKDFMQTAEIQKAVDEDFELRINHSTIKNQFQNERV